MSTRTVILLLIGAICLALGGAVAARPLRAGKGTDASALFSHLNGGSWIPENASSLDSTSLGLLAGSAARMHDSADLGRIRSILEHRGRRAFELGVPFDAFQDGTTNQADTLYLVSIADGAIASQDQKVMIPLATAALRSVPFSNGCWAYSTSPADARMGCVNDDNLSALALLADGGTIPAGLRGKFQEDLQRLTATQLPNGNWRYWAQAPKGRRSLIGTTDLAWDVYALATSRSAELRRLSQTSVRWLLRSFEPRLDHDGLPEIAGALIAAGKISPGCRLLRELPGWVRTLRSPPGLSSRWNFVQRRVISAAYFYGRYENLCTATS